MACPAKQVFYVNNPCNGRLTVVILSRSVDINETEESTFGNCEFIPLLTWIPMILDEMKQLIYTPFERIMVKAYERTFLSQRTIKRRGGIMYLTSRIMKDLAGYIGYQRDRFDQYIYGPYKERTPCEKYDISEHERAEFNKIEKTLLWTKKEERNKR
ncbi:hypothetical protein OROMI_011428 [Orobanche minor]